MADESLTGEKGKLPISGTDQPDSAKGNSNDTPGTGAEDQKPPPTRKNDRPTLLDLFRTHRDYLNHEHHLINQRLSWNFTIQGFLFAARGIVLGKVADIALDLSQKPILAGVFLEKSLQELRFASFIIAIVGLSVSLAVFFSVLAALRSMDGVTSNWEQFQSDANSAGLPGIMGGGSKGAVTIGFYAPLFLPTVLGLAWLVLLFHY